MKRQHRRRDTPTEHDDAWVDYGGERIWAVGITEGGVPYGLTVEEYEAAIEADERERLPRPNWADAKDVLCEIAHRTDIGIDRGTIGRMRHIGDGLSNVVFGGTIRLHDGEMDLVIKLPAPRALPDRDDRLRREAAVLRHLNAQRLTFAIPRPIGEVQTSTGLAVVQERVDGLEVDLRVTRFRGGKPWELVARVAAATHAIDPTPIRGFLPTYLTRRSHVEARVDELLKLDEVEVRDAGAWILEHFPPNAPAALLHGDLLGQNLRRPWEDTGRAGVIDWAEALIGDAAYDLAVVTRGHRKPFGAVDGLARLVEAYNRVPGSPLTIAEVHVHELLLHGGFYREAVCSFGARSPHAEQQRLTWRSLLRRVTQDRA